MVRPGRRIGMTTEEAARIELLDAMADTAKDIITIVRRRKSDIFKQVQERLSGKRWGDDRSK